MGLFKKPKPPAPAPVKDAATVAAEYAKSPDGIEEERRRRLLSLNQSSGGGQMTAAGGATGAATVGRKALLGL